MCSWQKSDNITFHSTEKWRPKRIKPEERKKIYKKRLCRQLVQFKTFIKSCTTIPTTCTFVFHTSYPFYICNVMHTKHKDIKKNFFLLLLQLVSFVATFIIHSSMYFIQTNAQDKPHDTDDALFFFRASLGTHTPLRWL